MKETALQSDKADRRYSGLKLVVLVVYIYKSPDEWATTKQACRDKRVVRLNLFLYLILRSTHMY